MSTYDAIFKRKSTRKFDQTPLDQQFLDEIETAISGFARLYDDVSISHRFSRKLKGVGVITAPHYLVLSGTGSDRELEAAGFAFQQLDLWLSDRGLGSVWLGMAKDAETKNSNDIVILAFGRAAGLPYRNLNEFSRKPIGEITNAPDDPCIQAAHLAPSGRNLQPWFFEKNTDAVLVYRLDIDEVALGYAFADLDMGIALCHYFVAADHNGWSFGFARADNLPDKPGFLPFGVISQS